MSTKAPTTIVSNHINQGIGESAKSRKKKPLLLNPDIQILPLSTQAKMRVQATREIITLLTDTLNNLKIQSKVNENPKHIFSDLTKSLNNAHTKLHHNIQKAPDSEIFHHKKIYRQFLNKFWKEGKISQRVIQKPRGYDGDYMTMEFMYQNRWEGFSPLGKCLHKYIVNDRSCASVRKRKTYFKKTISSLAQSIPELTVLSVACGPARELYEVFKSGIAPRRVVLFDQDMEALNYASKRLQNLVPQQTEIIKVNASVIDTLRQNSPLLRNMGPFHYIYSAGLYDYLSTILAKKLTRYLASMLTSDGRLEVGNFKQFPIGTFADLAADWKLILRAEDDMLELIPEGVEPSFFTLGDQIFMSLRRK